MDRRIVATSCFALVAVLDLVFILAFLRDVPLAFVLETGAVCALVLIAIACARLWEPGRERLFVTGWTLAAAVAAVRIASGLRFAQPADLTSLIIYNAGFIVGAAFAIGSFIDRKGLRGLQGTRIGATVAGVGLLLTLVAGLRFMNEAAAAALALKAGLLLAAGWALDTHKWTRPPTVDAGALAA